MTVFPTGLGITKGGTANILEGMVATWPAWIPVGVGLMLTHDKVITYRKKQVRADTMECLTNSFPFCGSCYFITPVLDVMQSPPLGCSL